MDTARIVAILTIPPVTGALIGGLTGWFFEDALVYEIKSKRWFLPLVCSLAGFGAGAFFGSRAL